MRDDYGWREDESSGRRSASRGSRGHRDERGERAERDRRPRREVDEWHERAGLNDAYTPSRRREDSRGGRRGG